MERSTSFETNSKKRKPSASSRPLRRISSLRSDSCRRSDAPSAQTRLALSVRQEAADQPAIVDSSATSRGGRLTNPRLADSQRASPVGPVRRSKHWSDRRERSAQRVATGRAGEGFGGGAVGASVSTDSYPTNNSPTMSYIYPLYRISAISVQSDPTKPPTTSTATFDLSRRPSRPLSLASRSPPEAGRRRVCTDGLGCRTAASRGRVGSLSPAVRPDRRGSRRRSIRE